MNIYLSPELEQFIQSRLDSGTYNSANEVIRDALQLLQEKEFIKQKRIEEFNIELEKGLASAREGRVITDKELMEHIQIRRQKFIEQND